MNQILTIPGELPSMNKIIDANRHNKYLGAKIKKQATEIAYWHALEQLSPFTDKVDLTITWYCKNRRQDKDNISSAIKFILDGVIKANKLKNDGWNEIGDIKHKFEIDKKAPRIEVIFEEVTEYGMK